MSGLHGLSRPETWFIVMRSLIVSVVWASACVPLHMNILIMHGRSMHILDHPRIIQRYPHISQSCGLMICRLLVFLNLKNNCFSERKSRRRQPRKLHWEFLGYSWEKGSNNMRLIFCDGPWAVLGQLWRSSGVNQSSFLAWIQMVFWILL